MDTLSLATRFRHIVFTPPSRGRLRSARTIFEPIRLSDELSLLPYDEETFLRSIFAQAKLDVRSYRIDTLKRRIPACLRALRTNSLDRARWMIRQDPAMLKLAIRAVLIGVTRFYRDAAVFQTLRELLPGMAAQSRSDGRKLRIWSAGCSEGAELYSVGLLLDDLGLLHEVSDLLGTDCRTDAISAARAGNYPRDLIEDLPAETVARRFRQEGKGWIISDTLRQLARWRAGDVTKITEPGKWDLILCRNMAMYLRPEASRTLWGLLEQALRPGGLLLLGKAERPDGAHGLSPVAPCIFRRRHA